MSATSKRVLIWVVIGLAVTAGLLFAFAPRAVTVDLETVNTGPMVVTADEEGETRIHDVFVLSAPLAGRVRRIEVHVGDAVVANETVLARIEPGDPSFLDPRSEAQAKAAVQTADSARSFAAAEVEQASAELDFSRIEYHRARRLIVDGTITRREAEEAQRRYRSARAAVATAQAGLQMRNFELQQAQAQLLSPADTRGDRADCACVELTAPVSGRVLRVVNPSERIVSAAEPLVEIGDPRDLEIAVDYLSMDAVRVEPGQRVRVTDWGGDDPLAGVVRRVEPFGFTKVSALGIEEQRVNVIVDLTSPLADWSRLGHGYQVETRIVLWERDAVISIPLTALFRDGEHWATFAVEAGRATLRHLDLGRRNALSAEVISGISAGDQVVLHPSDRVTNGTRVVGRSDA